MSVTQRSVCVLCNVVCSNQLTLTSREVSQSKIGQAVVETNHYAAPQAQYVTLHRIPVLDSSIR